MPLHWQHQGIHARELTMTRRVALSALRMMVGSVVGIVIGAVATTGFLATRGVEAAQQGGRAQGAPATPPSPCGPKATLPENFSVERRPELALLRDSHVLADPSRDGVGQFKGGINELHRGSASKRSPSSSSTVRKSWVSGNISTIPTRSSGCWRIATVRIARKSGPRSARIRVGRAAEEVFRSVEDEHLPDERV